MNLFQFMDSSPATTVIVVALLVFLITETLRIVINRPRK